MADLNIGWWVLILFVGLVVVVFGGKHIGKIISVLWKILLKIVLGFIILFFFNIFGQLINIHIPLNFFTATVTGILGLPGLILLIIFKILFM